MLHDDLMIAFIVMGILFLRQIVILKRPNKINYAPLILGVGAIGSIVHFIIHTQNTNILLLIRESLFPLLFALILYVIMNILHQTQQSQLAKTQEEFIKVLLQQMNQLKSFLLDIEKRIAISRSEDRNAQEEIREKFKEDIKALDSIQLNQTKLINKFDMMENISKDVSKSFNYFSEVKLPELDNIVHTHIDILRVAEQDHYKKLQNLLNEALDNRFNFTNEINEVKVKLDELKMMAGDISQDIVSQTSSKLSTLTKAFENEILLLKSHASSMDTTLSESENRLVNVKNQSEMIIKQMILSVKNMHELESKTADLPKIFSQFSSLIEDIEAIKSDYVKSQSQLGNILKTLESSTADELYKMNEKLENSLEKLSEHYAKIDSDKAQNVNLLAKKAQLKKGYSELEK
ncbi:hypothetical protein [Sulfurimonas autotrophica]|uniref:Interaptin n=1 Tax=Sulfurimonas autotrophica (strain ATCC BAA-671 / DSM 16294 / JCM 11897 / OK10) TaxID=563040 RepID=E0US47_SULAO|nr:hypothetical protein [Sulfurimonas autotrophica]ADN09070.1 conserved hypothetical protein [Sulfurimonas autotrophica DSM 16294]